WVSGRRFPRPPTLAWTNARRRGGFAGRALDIGSACWHDGSWPEKAKGRNADWIAMKISTFFTRFFTWWNGQTFGTQVWTSLYGELVGADQFGYRYYRTKDGQIDPTLHFERRWVIYNGYAEASMIPPTWH